MHARALDIRYSNKAVKISSLTDYSIQAGKFVVTKPGCLCIQSALLISCAGKHLFFVKSTPSSLNQACSVIRNYVLHARPT